MRPQQCLNVGYEADCKMTSDLPILDYMPHHHLNLLLFSLISGVWGWRDDGSEAKSTYY